MDSFLQNASHRALSAGWTAIARRTRPFALLLALTGGLPAWGQTPKPTPPPAPANRRLDSLQRLLRAHSAPDTGRVGLLVRVAGELPAAAAAAPAAEALRLARGLGFTAGEALASFELGKGALRDGRIKEALPYFERSLALWRAGGHPASIIRGQNALASVYANQGRLPEALALFAENLRIAERLRDRSMQLQSLANLGTLTKMLYDYPRSLRYTQQALSVVDTVADRDVYGSLLCNATTTYLELADYASVATYGRRALRVSRELGDVRDQATVQLALGQVQLRQGQPDAHYHFEQALALSRPAKNYFIMTNALNSLGKIAVDNHQPALARTYLTEALALSRKNGEHSLTASAYDGLSKLYAQTRQFDQAYANEVLHRAYADSAESVKVKADARALQVRYETERKEADNRLQAAQLLAQQQTIRRRNAQLLAGGAGLLLLGGAGYAFYARRRRRREAEFVAERQRLLHQRTAAVLEAEETERRRIGADLHDGVGQLLTAARQQLSVLAQELDQAPSPARAQLLDAAQGALDESFAEVRGISHNLVPNALLRQGLGAAVREFLRAMSAGGGLRAEVEVVGLDARLPPALESTLFRVIQELSQNVVKHARASQISLQIVRDDDELRVLVEDNGVGFDPVAARGAAGLGGIGLANVETRLAYLGGQAYFDAAPGRGTVVTLTVPLAGVGIEEMG